MREPVDAQREVRHRVAHLVVLRLDGGDRGEELVGDEEEEHLGGDCQARGERANFRGLVLGCIEGKLCKKICV